MVWFLKDLPAGDVTMVVVWQVHFGMSDDLPWWSEQGRLHEVWTYFGRGALHILQFALFTSLQQCSDGVRFRLSRFRRCRC